MMGGAPYATIVRGAKLAAPEGPAIADLAVADGRIVAIAAEVEGGAAETIDARGLWVLPGVVDAHVHLNDPGRTGWEGWETGTRALAAGGTTTAVDMPINSVPPTTTVDALITKRTVAERHSLVDFGLWGGLQPDNISELEPLHAAGAVAFKAFMCTTGLDEFVAADDLTLYEGMAEIARLGSLVGVHAENDAITRGLAQRAVAMGHRGVREFLATRPIISELEAIGRAILIAEETGCALHVVHVSSGAGLALVAEARARGVDVTCETCPHYLVLSDEDVERLGAVAKCTPPIRTASEREELWRALSDGTLPMVASDHSPAAVELKQGDDFFAIWGGISGCQTMLELLLSEGHHQREVSLERIVEATTSFPARRFGLQGKGAIEVGSDADLTFVALDEEHSISADGLFYRHRISPYVGMRLRGRVVRTMLRGTTLFENGQIVSSARGRQVRPARVEKEMTAVAR